MLRGAIIGFGGVARNGHWPAYAGCAEVEIVAVVDRSPARRALAASLRPGLRTFERLDDLGVSMDIDFIDICTPPALHPQPMFEAIARKWHVLCEKPFLLDPAMVQRARRSAEESGIALVPVHNWKYAPIVQAATRALRAGVIGRLTRATIETSRIRAAPTVDADGSNWRRDPAMAGGGILMDHGWHSVYLALHWFGDGATTVRASLHHPASGGVEDEASVVVEFPTGEATINLSWNGDIRRNGMELVGSEGRIVIADDTLAIHNAAIETTNFPSALSTGSHHADWFAAMLPDVVEYFHHPALSRPLFEEAAACLSIIQQAYRSDHSLA